MRKFRVNRKEGKIKKRKVIAIVAAYRYIPHHMHTILFDRVTFCGQKELIFEQLFCISFCKGMIRHFVNVLYKSKCLWAYHLKQLPRN